MIVTAQGTQTERAIPAAAAAEQPAPRGLVAALRDLGWVLREMARQSPRAAAILLTLSVLNGVTTPIMLWASAGVANGVQERLDGRSGSLLWWFAGAWILVTVIEQLWNPLWWSLLTRAQIRGNAALFQRALDKATRIDLASYEHQTFYDRFGLVIANLRDNVNRSLSSALQIGWAFLRSITYVAVLLAFDWRLAAIAVVAIAPAMWVWFFTGGLHFEILREQTRERRLATYYGSLLVDRQPAKEVRLFGLAPTILERWEEMYWATARQLRNRSVRAGIRQRGLSFASFSIGILGFAWFMGTTHEGLGAGTVVVLVAVFFDIYGGFMNAGQAVTELGKLAGFTRDLRIFLALPEETDTHREQVGPPPEASELVLDEVCFTYPGAAEPVLRDVSLRVDPGETIALVGENGAGKTTLVKLMLGLYQPDRGRILLDGEDLATADPARIRQRLSGVFQHFTRYPLTARENVTLGDPELDDAVPAALDVVGLAALHRRLPNGLDTVLSPDLGGEDLSGGQWQRIAIARAGIRNASLVALDEPTSALDPLAEVAIFTRFAELAANRTTILVSHRLGMARLADRIVTLEHGRIIETGTHDELVARQGSRYAEMWEAQARWYR